MDVAWALFELRVHRDPAADPNAVWTDITRDYLHIAPHPEWSWWAMRGQLVESPGYMMNYALGALIAAELRAKIRAERGTFSRPDPKMYDWLADRLYRWGLERPSREVLEGFLGHPLGTAAIVADISRLGRR
jgi:Zn-dependent M32 family carboxypeptidase